MPHVHSSSSSSSSGSSGSSGSEHHRDKRLFQPSITNFFSADDDQPAHARPKSTPKQRAPAFPSVPGAVQSDLLSVGMRVRKSVPEGYKTHKTLGLPSIQTTLAGASHRSHTSTTATAHVLSASPPREPVPSALQHQRELLPFCGLHKIGGYAEQPVDSTANGGDAPVNLFPLPPQAFSQPFSSQDSMASAVSIESAPRDPENLHKRAWDDENGELPADFASSKFLFAHPMKIAEDEAPVSPLSDTPAPTFGGALRPFAQPKSRKQVRSRRVVDVDGGLLKEVDMDMVENAIQGEERLPSESSSDFGEAPFLQPWSSPLREVEMGGV